MLEQYPTKVKLVSKNFPLSFHKLARPAAIAVLAAGEQGKYWEYHEKVFDNFNKLTDQKFLDFAKELGLNIKTFKKSLKNPKLQKAISKDIRDGQGAGVTGTPSIFINGRRLKNRSLDGFKAIIEAELKKKGRT